MAHSNAELFLTKQDKRAVKSVLLRHWHLLCTSVVKMHCSRPTVLGLKSDAKENNMHVHGVDCYQRHALQQTHYLGNWSPRVTQDPSPCIQGDSTLN